MNDIRPIERPEAGGWTQLASASQIQAQPRTGEPFAIAVKANIAVRGFHRSAGCRGLDLGPEEAVAQLRDGKVRHRSLGSKRGALRRKEKVVKGEVERFGASLARLNALGAASGAAATSGGAEAGAMQAGDLMQDLKTGHLLGAAPNAQFWGQVIGATVGAVVSALVYRLYTAVYEVPGDLFQVPTAFVWIFTARLVTGRGLPPMAREFATGAAILFAVITVVRSRATAARGGGNAPSWLPYVPGGIAVAVGMYNVPSFTLARTVGGIANWYWRVYLGREDTPLIVLASVRYPISFFFSWRSVLNYL